LEPEIAMILPMMIALAFLTSVAASAQTTTAQPAKPGTVDMTIVLKDEYGNPIKDNFGVDSAKDPRCEECKPLTAGHAISHSLFIPLTDARGQDNETAEQKWANAALAMRIRDNPAAILSAAEVKRIEEHIGKTTGAIIIMQIFPLIDPNAKVPEVK
jgi:hypothetical protein